MERATGTEVYGCGSPQTSDITLNIQTTTGGNFSVSVNGKNTVEHLKKLVSKKLRVSKDRICLLHRERQLSDGTLEENGLLDGSRVILLPSVETGLLSHRPENSVMQALESLNDTQVNDFLSGKSPLNLTMRLGDHMMLIQLQLSTLNNGSGSRSLRTSTPSKATASTSSSSTSTATTSRTKCDAREAPSPQTAPPTCTPVPMDHSYISSDNPKPEPDPHGLQKDFEMLQNCFDLYRKMAEEKFIEETCDACKAKQEAVETPSCTISDISDTSIENEQSPIKSLSNLVSSPIDSTSKECISEQAALVNSVKNDLIDFLSQNKLDDVITSSSAMCDKQCPPTSSQTPDSSDDSDNFTDQSSFLAESTIDEYPMENLFNSAVDKGLFEDQDESMMDREISNLATTSHGSQEANTGALPSFQSINEPLKNKRFQYLLHKTSKFKHPIGQNKQKAFMQSVVNKHKKRMQSRQDTNLSQPSTSRTEPYITNSRKLILQPSTQGQTDDNATPSTSKQVTFKAPDAPKKPQRASPTPPVDTKALIEASKNLTQKLKKLSKEVLTNKIDLRTAEDVRTKIGPGAVIESMKHHGKGIYSGTFSGTLNPALQDRYGRPKRDISTIIHILNDLLCAAPPIALGQKDTSHTCTVVTDETGKCSGCSQAGCAHGQCDGHAPSTSAAAKHCACEIKDCQCLRLEPKLCATCVGKAAGDICKKCDTAKTVAMENSKTKCKLEQLRLVMQQKKQRREARKLKTLPYTNSPSKTIASPEQAPPVIKEEIETVA
ncbi:ubiquitin-like domain-containing protein stuxnet [Anticarsia gemmatalis]|uniref:ubiquitin-like domain-containing protein stuxnet n=1 Tax=Anticarsia gemmatalis TaxID=129554 RepID=UPI003F75EB58